MCVTYLQKPTRDMAQPGNIRANTPLTETQSRAHTWGVELECIFAFHRKRLEKVLQTYTEDLRPEIDEGPERAHDRILQKVKSNEFDDANQCRTKWPSWLLRVPKSDRAFRLSRKLGDHSNEVGWTFWERLQFREGEDDLKAKPVYRTYALEPLLIAQDVLSEKQLTPRIIGGKIQHYGGHLDANDFDEIFNATYHAPVRSMLFSSLEAAVLAEHKDKFKYDEWIVTRDFSVPPATQREIVAALGLPEGDRKEWNSDGVELVSKKYDYAELDVGCQKLAQYLAQFRHAGLSEPLRGTPADAEEEGDSRGTTDDLPKPTGDTVDTGQIRTWGAFDSVFAGTHVHIGLDWTLEEGVDFDFLRHFAFLLISNEQLISGLHAFRRHGKLTSFTPVDAVFTPAEVRHRTRSEYEEDRMKELAEKYISQHSIWSNQSSFMKYNKKAEGNTCQTQQDAANILFSDGTDHLEIFRMFQREMADFVPAHGVLVDLHRIANWYKYSCMSEGERAYSPLPICTIEFCQHGCTLDAEEVKHWVKFLFALVRLAEKRAKQTTDYFNVPLQPLSAYESRVEREMAKHPPVPLTMEAFCSGKNLDPDREEIDYWKARVEQYADSKQTYFATTEERRRRRRERKARFGIQLTPTERAALESAPGASEYERMTRQELLAMIKDRLGTDMGRDVDQRRIKRLNAVSKRDLVKMAVRMDTKLRADGEYIPPANADENTTGRRKALLP